MICQAKAWYHETSNVQVSPNACMHEYACMRGMRGARKERNGGGMEWKGFGHRIDCNVMRHDARVTCTAISKQSQSGDLTYVGET